VKLGPISPRDIAEALTTRALTDPKNAAQIAHMAAGSYSEALKLLRSSDNDLFPEVRQLFNALFTNNGIAIGKFVEEWSKAGREQQKNFLSYTIQLLEQAIKMRYRPDGVSLPDREAQFVQKLSETKISFETLGNMANTISDTIFYIERNAHSKTQLHALAIKLQYIIRNTAIPA
jgi:DNA polymerase-3 subunit delta'